MAKRKLKTISERLKERREFLGLTQEQMAFVLDRKEQMYKLYEHGSFDDTYSIKEDYLIVQMVYLEDGLDEKIDTLQNAKRLFIRYAAGKGRTETPPRKIWLKARIKFLQSELENCDKENLLPVIHQNGTPKHKKKSGKKNGRALHKKEQNLNEKTLN